MKGKQVGLLLNSLPAPSSLSDLCYTAIWGSYIMMILTLSYKRLCDDSDWHAGEGNLFKVLKVGGMELKIWRV